MREKKIKKLSCSYGGAYKRQSEMESESRNSRSLLVLNLLKEGVDKSIISRSIGIEIEDILELKGLMEVGYGDCVQDIEYARKRRVALNMLRDKVDEKIISTVSGLGQNKVSEVKSLAEKLDQLAEEKESMAKKGLSSIH